MDMEQTVQWNNTEAKMVTNGKQGGKLGSEDMEEIIG